MYTYMYIQIDILRYLKTVIRGKYLLINKPFFFNIVVYRIDMNKSFLSRSNKYPQIGLKRLSYIICKVNAVAFGSNINK